MELVQSVDHPGHLADLIAANLPIELAQKQGILETFDLAERLKKVTALLHENDRCSAPGHRPFRDRHRDRDRNRNR